MPSDLRNGIAPLKSASSPNEPRLRGITALTVTIPGAYRPDKLESPGKPKSRWRTAEFGFYYVVAAFAIPAIVWVPVSVSLRTHINYRLYEPRLSPGWLFGRKVDNSDDQYRGFRTNIPILTLLSFLYLSLKFLFDRIRKLSLPNTISDNLHLVPFHVIFALLMLVGLHGASIIKILVILSLNYATARTFKGSKLNPIVTWIFNLAVLYGNYRNHGYTFASLHPALESLDAMNGVRRWHLGFNITMLRLVSFNTDYSWACNTSPKPHETGVNFTDKQRKETPHSLEHYSFMNYISYTLYSPLYIGGPIITFNDFMWQLRAPTRPSARSNLSYLLRFLICLLTMEFVLHFMYVVAIKDSRAWTGYSPAQVFMLGFWNLIVVWLKLLIPWRFFRLWALLDGIDPPENMVRCVANNYSVFGFWRSWHRSYNLWCIRYIYIPLGGSKHTVINSLIVFTFVALWHDISFKLLAWGWLISFIILPELVAKWALPEKKYGTESWYRPLCATGAVVNMLLMAIANSVGFVVGLDGTRYLLGELFGTIRGIGFSFGACSVMWIWAQLMFEYREEEMRRGIYRRC